MSRRVVSQTLIDVSEELTALMMEAVSTSETSVNLYETERRDAPEDKHIQARNVTMF
jgi:hypothetical protein